MSTPIVECIEASKIFAVRRGGRRFDVRALDEVSLSLSAGRTLGVVGESGSGKSTLGRVLSLLLPTSAGEVRVAGTPARELDRRRIRELRRRFQIVWQNPFNSMNVKDTIEVIVTEAPIAHGMLAKRERSRRAEEILASVGLPGDLLSKRPGQLSGGQLQRIAIGRALALEPELMICDEVTSALDVSVQAQILNLLHEVQRRTNVAYLFISHDLHVVKHISDEVVVMYGGRVLEAGAAPTVYTDPQHPYTQELVRIASAQQTGDVSLAELPTPGGAPVSGCCYWPSCSLRQPVCELIRPTLEASRGDGLVACHVTAPAPARAAEAG